MSLRLFLKPSDRKRTFSPGHGPKVKTREWAGGTKVPLENEPPQPPPSPPPSAKKPEQGGDPEKCSPALSLPLPAVYSGAGGDGRHAGTGAAGSGITRTTSSSKQEHVSAAVPV